jgi:diguanylate cyclase (GGDEF)-like protein
MQRRGLGVEAHFSLFWLAITLGLLPSAGAWMSGSAWRPAGDLMLVLAPVAVHRGLLTFYRQTTPDVVYLGLMLLTLVVALLAPRVPGGEYQRVAWLHLLVALGCGATALTFWQMVRRRMPMMAAVVGASLLLMMITVLMRFGQSMAPATAGVPLGSLVRGFDSGSIVSVFFVAGLFNLVQIRLVLGRVLRRLLEQTQIDALTGVANRRGFMLALDGAHHRAARARSVYGLLIIDIDHFKRINDEQGHPAGDVVLRSVARLLAETVRMGETVGRIGGEEFCLLLPTTGRAGAERLAERARAVVEAGTAVTVSVGVTIARPAYESAEAAHERADRALYQAKNEGRNRVVTAEE